MPVMRISVCIVAALVGCTEGASPAGPKAELDVTIGAVPGHISSVAVSSSTSTRLLMQAKDAKITVHVSIAVPLVEGLTGIETQDVSAWAKESDAVNPLLATSGTVTSSKNGNLWSFRMNDVAKPEDASGPSLVIRGTIDGVNIP